MEIYQLEDDIRLLCLKASSFPDGIAAAHEKLRNLVPAAIGRTYYGISFPDRSGHIIYKVAANERLPGEAEKLGLETFILKKGNYISTVILDFDKAPERITQTFQEMIHRPDIDPQGCCVEIYLGEKDVQCMVRLRHSAQ